MEKKENPWWMSFDRIALVLFVIGAWTVNGSNQLRVLGITLVICFIAKYCLSSARWKYSDHPKEVFCYLLWGIWVGLSGLLVCSSKVFFWMNYRVLLQMCIMIICIYGMLRLRMSERLLYSVIIVGCVVQMLAVRLGYSLDLDENEIISGVEQLGENRVSGLVGNANGLGFIMLSGVHCAMQMWRMKPSPLNLLWKILLVCFLISAIYMTFATGSRKTTMALGMLVVSWLVWLLPQNKGVSVLLLRIVLVLSIIAVSGTILAFVMNDTVVGQRFIALSERGGGSIVEGAEEDVRADMYKEGWKLFLAHPIAGVGLGHFQLYYWKGMYSHSDYMEPLACTGLVGFIIYQSFNLFLLMRISRLRRRVRDADEKYKLGAMLLTLVVHLLLGVGCPYWSAQRPYILLTIFATYTWMLERRLREGVRIKVMRHS